MYRKMKAAMMLSVLWAGTAGAAVLELTETEHAAMNACFELQDEQAGAECFRALQLPLPPELQRLAELAADPVANEASECWRQAADVARREHMDALAATGTPHNLLAAVLLSPPEATDTDPLPDAMANVTFALPERVVGWFDAARNATPADPLVAWWEATGCVAANLDCSSADATSRLLRVDAGNAAVQLLALDAAHSAGDIVAARTHLRLAAEAGRFEPYDRAQLELVRKATAGIALPPIPAEVAEGLGIAYGFDGPVTGDDIHAVEAMAQWAALSMVPMQSLTRMCDPRDDMETALKQDCLEVLEQLAGSSNMVVYPALALDLLVRLTAREPVGAYWRERLRAHLWLYDQALPLMGRWSGSPTEHLRLWEKTGEVGAWQTLLLQHGIALDPPSGWLPDNPSKRALVTTGRLPPTG